MTFLLKIDDFCMYFVHLFQILICTVYQIDSMNFFFFSYWFMLIHHQVCHQHVHSCCHLYEWSFKECICNKSLIRFFIHVLKQMNDFECLNHLSMHFICNQSISFYISELLYWLWLFWSRSCSFRLISISHQFLINVAM